MKDLAIDCECGQCDHCANKDPKNILAAMCLSCEWTGVVKDCEPDTEIEYGFERTIYHCPNCEDWASIEVSLVCGACHGIGSIDGKTPCPECTIKLEDGFAKYHNSLRHGGTL